VLLVFKILENYNLYVSKNYKIYSMKAYTCPEYSCKVLIEIALYFELEEKQKIVATHRLIFLSFLYSSNTTYFF
jgi:hypothetical protein